MLGLMAVFFGVTLPSGHERADRLQSMYSEHADIRDFIYNVEMMKVKETGVFFSNTSQWQ